jgi:hypothetical protein
MCGPYIRLQQAGPHQREAEAHERARNAAHCTRYGRFLECKNTDSPVAGEGAPDMGAHGDHGYRVNRGKEAPVVCVDGKRTRRARHFGCTATS